MKKQYGKGKNKNDLSDKRYRVSSRGDVRHEEYLDWTAAHRPEKVEREPVKGKTRNQERYINAIKNFTLTFATGPAGTGKTYIAAALASDALLDNPELQIILTRPAVEAGENLGFLPGELDEKFDPYLQPFLDVLNRRLGKRHVENLMKTERILAVPLAYMRGRTFRNAFVILDEAQNTSPTQMKMFLTRIGEDCKVVVNGDLEQKDIPGDSGLDDAIRRCSWIPSVKTVEFLKTDIVRSGLVQEIVNSYSHLTPLSAPL